MSIITALFCTNVPPSLETISLSISYPLHCKLKTCYLYEVNACIVREHNIEHFAAHLAPALFDSLQKLRIGFNFNTIAAGFELSSDGDEERVQVPEKEYFGFIVNQTLLKNTKEVFEVWMDINNVPMYQMGRWVDGGDEE